MKAIVFDFDGTLENTLPITPSEIKEMFGLSETGIISYE